MNRFFAYEGADQWERVRLRRRWVESWKAGKKKLEKEAWKSWYAVPANAEKHKEMARKRSRAAREKKMRRKEKQAANSVHSDDSDFAL